MTKMTSIFPITFSGFQRSRQSTIFSSGLAIDIAGVSFSDDEQKQNLLFDSRSFEFYLALAKQYGFSVNKRNPGVLISDLASPVTSEYRNNYDLSTINLVFASFSFNKFFPIHVLMSSMHYVNFSIALA